MDNQEFHEKRDDKSRNKETKQGLKERTNESVVVPNKFEQSTNEFQAAKTTIEPFNAPIGVAGNEETYHDANIEDQEDIGISYEIGEGEIVEDEDLERIIDDQDEEDVEEYMDLLGKIEEQSEKVEAMKARLGKMWAKETKTREEIVVIRDLHTAIEQESAKLKSLIQRVVEVQQQHSAHRYEQFQTPTESNENL